MAVGLMDTTIRWLVLLNILHLVCYAVFCLEFKANVILWALIGQFLPVVSADRHRRLEWRQTVQCELELLWDEFRPRGADDRCVPRHLHHQNTKKRRSGTNTGRLNRWNWFAYAFTRSVIYMYMYMVHVHVGETVNFKKSHVGPMLFCRDARGTRITQRPTPDNNPTWIAETCTPKIGMAATATTTTTTITRIKEATNTVVIVSPNQSLHQRRMVISAMIFLRWRGAMGWTTATMTMTSLCHEGDIVIWSLAILTTLDRMTPTKRLIPGGTTLVVYQCDTFRISTFPII